jgi:hypothetical protein
MLIAVEQAIDDGCRQGFVSFQEFGPVANQLWVAMRMEPRP